MTDTDLSRRTLIGVLGGGAAATLLAGCGGENDSEPTADPAPSSGSEDGKSEDGKSEGGGSGGEPGGTPLVATADVPVGSGIILKDEEVVVTQPEEGTFAAFTAICTHMGCVVGEVDGDQIKCPCHGSVFSTADGSVVEGPAQEPLAAVEVTVEGDQVVKA
jgi:Rieske Fe-S protein